MKTASWLLLITILSSQLAACGLVERVLPDNAVQITVTANTGLTPWLTAAVEKFNQARTKNAAGQPIRVALQSVEAGQTISDLTKGGALPALWIPDEPVWVEVLADKGQTAFQGACVSVAQSPLVIAMWRPLAESLGWPGRTLGWLDVGSLAADASAWAYYSGGQFGPTLRLGHTHPGLSNTGVSTLLAVVQAAQSKKAEAVTADDIQQPIVRASVGAFEGAVAWFSKSTGDLGLAMRARGLNFLGAAVMYESTVLQFSQGSGDRDPDLVPIYPFEGTFVATHPACLNRSADSGAQEAAGLFRAFLLSEAAQQLAIASGLRPVSNLPWAAPLDAAHGVDAGQPASIFPAPTVATLYAAQEAWQAARKRVNLVMLLDVSGSMQGDKIKNMRAAAVQFVRQMGDEDYLTLITFSNSPALLLEHVLVGSQRTAVVEVIQGLLATGGTSLFDAIGDGADVIGRTTLPTTTNVLVVLTDGKDTASTRHQLDPELVQAAAANSTTVFTIAYGSDADETVLADLAQQANGNYYRGDEASIAAIYEEMSAAFGGSVGVGR